MRYFNKLAPDTQRLLARLLLSLVMIFSVNGAVYAEGAAAVLSTPTVNGVPTIPGMPSSSVPATPAQISRARGLISSRSGTRAAALSAFSTEPSDLELEQLEDFTDSEAPVPEGEALEEQELEVDADLQGEELLPVPEELGELLEPSLLDQYIADHLELQFESIERFGADIFANQERPFVAPENMPVGADYLIGPGDEVKISLWGMVNVESAQVVNREGLLVLPQLGTLSVAGMTFEQLQLFLRQEYTRYYKASEVMLNVSLGALRTMRVFLVGNVAQPGTYNLSSLSTVIHALFAAGGPNQIGSMRNIQVNRAGSTVVNFDFYDFLLHGDRSGDIRLMPEDVVFVPTVGAQVTLMGDVKRPAIYELQKDVGLFGLIKMAGGVKASGYLQRVQVERMLDNQAKIIFDIDIAELDAKKGFRLEDGDQVRVFKINEAVTNYVRLVGNFVRTGTYEWKAGLRVADVVTSLVDFMPETHLDFVMIERLVAPDLHKEYFSFSPLRLFLSEDESANVKLEPFDTLVAFNKWDLLDKNIVSVRGAVNMPGIFEWRQNMRVSDLLRLAGGPKEQAYANAARLVRREISGEKVSYRKYDIDIARVLAGDLDADLVLEHKDRLLVDLIPEFDLERKVELLGNIHNPGAHPWFAGMRLTDLIKPDRVTEAFLDDTLFSFGMITRVVPPDNHLEYLPFSPQAAFVDQTPGADLELMPRDKIQIYSRWEQQKRVYVTISGSLHNPGEYEYRQNMTLADLVVLAGGLERAEYPGSYLGEGLIIRRMPPDFAQEKVSFSLRSILTGSVVAGGPQLTAFDEVFIFDAWVLSQEQVVSIFGAVGNPNAFSWIKGLRVADLLKLAGGTKYYAYMLRAELTRIEPGDSGPVQSRFEVDLNRVLEGDQGHNLLLLPNDLLMVRKVPEWQLYTSVDIEGEFRFPGRYTIRKGERLSSLIKRAGGFTDDAYLKGAIFSRESVRVLQQRQLDESIDILERQALTSSMSDTQNALSAADASQEQQSYDQKTALFAKMRAAKAKGRVAIKLTENLEGSIYDMILEEGDQITIPSQPQQIQVLGAVYNQTAFIYEPDADLKGYLARAGGFTENADKDEIFILKVDGTALSRRSDGSFFASSFLKKHLDPGDTVVVPEKLEQVAWMKEIKDLTQILYQIAVTSAVLIVAF